MRIEEIGYELINRDYFDSGEIAEINRSVEYWGSEPSPKIEYDAFRDMSILFFKDGSWDYLYERILKLSTDYNPKNTFILWLKFFKCVIGLWDLDKEIVEKLIQEELLAPKSFLNLLSAFWSKSTMEQIALSYPEDDYMEYRYLVDNESDVITKCTAAIIKDIYKKDFVNIFEIISDDNPPFCGQNEWRILSKYFKYNGVKMLYPYFALGGVAQKNYNNDITIKVDIDAWQHQNTGNGLLVTRTMPIIGCEMGEMVQNETIKIPRNMSARCDIFQCNESIIIYPKNNYEIILY